MNDPIREFQTAMQRKIDNAERLRPLVKSCQDAMQRADGKGTIIITDRHGSRPIVEIMLICERLDDTVPLFRELAKEGLKTDKKDTHKDHQAFEIIAMREYNLGPDLKVIATIFTSKDSKGTCRMEQVGVKEVPVYEMKCD
jgi:hypothetical protein